MQYFEVTGTLGYEQDGVEQRLAVVTRLDAESKDAAIREVLDDATATIHERASRSATPPQVGGIAWLAPPTVRVLTDVCFSD